MKTLLLTSVLAAAGCANILDIPDRHAADDSKCTPGQTVKVKILYDASGATADVGVPFFKGQTDFIREINSTGGIRGCIIDYEAKDYGYSPPSAQGFYDGWKAAPDWNDVVAILGWGSSDSILLAPQARDDRKPYISASYFPSLAAPMPITADVSIPELRADFTETTFSTHFSSDGYGYNFFAGTDYSTAVRIAMFQVASQAGKRVGFFYCNGNDYCKGPIPAARSSAKANGLALGRDLFLELTESQAIYDTKVMNYFNEELAQKAKDPSYKIVDWVWGGNTTKTSAFMAKSIGKVNAALGTQLGFNVQMIINNWGFDENLFTGCGADCIDRVHGVMPFTAYGDSRAGKMLEVTTLHDKYRGIDAVTDGNVTFKNVRYVQGYVNVLLFRIGVDKVITAGLPITGDNIKAALEGLMGVDTGGLTGHLAFTPLDHRPQSTEQVYKFNAMGQLVPESQRTITMEDGWLGW
jgi:branched-chain amino acid transport system substrate-binding protein